MREYVIVDYISKLEGGSSLVSNDDDADMNGDEEEEGLDLSDNAFPDALSEDDADDDGAECTSLVGMNFSGGSVDAFCRPCETEFQSAPTQELCESSMPVVESTNNLPAGDGQTTTTPSVEAGSNLGAGDGKSTSTLSVAVGTPVITHDPDHTAKKGKNQSDDQISISSTSSHDD